MSESRPLPFAYALDEDGRTPVPIDLYDGDEWVALVAAWMPRWAAGAVVGRDQVGDLIVSTMFMCCNLNSNPEGPPLLWETAVLNGELADVVDRYPTLEAAQAGHDRVVAQLADVTPEPDTG